MEISVDDAEKHFLRLLQRVEAGEEVTLVRAGIPVARLLPVARRTGKRELGLDGDSIKIADDFDGPLPDEILAGFLGTEPPRKKRKGK